MVLSFVLLLATQHSLPQGEFQSLLVPDPGAPVEVEIFLGNSFETLVLSPHRFVRDDSPVVEIGPSGVSHHESLVGTTYRGFLKNHGGSRVAGSLYNGQLIAWVLPGPGQDPWWVTPVDAERSNGVHRVYRTAATVAGSQCGTGSNNLSPQQVSSTAPPLGPNSTIRELSILLDSDYYYFEQFPDVSSCANHMLAVANIVSSLYESQVGIALVPSAPVVRTVAAAPYDDNCASLGDVTAAWWGSGIVPAENLVHLSTGVGAGIPGDCDHAGYATIGSICRPGVNPRAISRYTGILNGHVSIVTHEIGHALGAHHLPPGETGVMQPTASTTVFHPITKAAIEAHLATYNCLPTAQGHNPPTVVTVEPSTWDATGQRVVVTGTDLENVLEIHVGTTKLLVYNGQIDLIDSTHLEFTAPNAADLGYVNLSVVGAGGYDDAGQVEYVATSPALLHEPLSVDSGPLFGVYYYWEFGAEPGDTAYVTYNLTGDTYGPGPIPLLSNRVLVASVPLDAAGIGTHTELTAEFEGVPLHSQVLFYRPGVGFVEATNITESCWQSGEPCLP